MVQQKIETTEKSAPFKDEPLKYVQKKVFKSRVCEKEGQLYTQMTSYNRNSCLEYSNESCRIFFRQKFRKNFRERFFESLALGACAHCAGFGAGKPSFFILSEISTNNSILWNKKRLSKHLLIRIRRLETFPHQFLAACCVCCFDFSPSPPPRPLAHAKVNCLHVGSLSSSCFSKRTSGRW